MNLLIELSKTVSTHKIFYIIVFIKLILMYLFTSEYNNTLFYPFVNSFNLNMLNPWEYYLENNLDINSFPYHPLMLYILTPFSNISKFFDLVFLFKLPLFFADLIILYVLLNLIPNKEKSIYLFYFFNPIILYSTYIHSQLDIIPTALFMLCIYFIVNKKYYLSSFIFGLSLATKIHIIIALPLIIFYLYKSKYMKVILYYVCIALSIFLLFDLPFIFSDGFIKMVLLNSKQSILFDSFYDIGEVKLILPVAAILSVYFHFFNQNKVNNDLLYFYFGILFTSAILFIYPAPAWYVWLIPFVSIYFIKSNSRKAISLYSTFSIAYLIFFLFFYKSEYRDIMFLDNFINLKIENQKLTNLSFTLLEVMLFAIMYAFYKHGIKSNSIYKKRTNLAIGIGGDSGVGKTSLLYNFTLLFKDKILQIEGDGEHKWERGDENWNKYTHLDPKANYIHKQADAIRTKA